MPIPRLLYRLPKYGHLPSVITLAQPIFNEIHDFLPVVNWYLRRNGFVQESVMLGGYGVGTHQSILLLILKLLPSRFWSMINGVWCRFHQEFNLVRSHIWLCSLMISWLLYWITTWYYQVFYAVVLCFTVIVIPWQNRIVLFGLILNLVHRQAIKGQFWISMWYFIT